MTTIQVTENKQLHYIRINTIIDTIVYNTIDTTIYKG